MKAARIVVALLASCATAGMALAATPEPPPGAASCSGCHAAKVATAVPRIHGRKADEIVAAMTAFRSGSRPGTVMDRIAKGFTDEETQAIAAWLAAQP